MNGSTAIGITDSRSLTVSGEFSPRGTTVDSGLAFQLGSGIDTTNRNGVLDQTATGKVLLDVYDNGSNEYFNIVGLTSGTKLTLNGTVELRLQGGYTPLPGHSFDLWDLADGSLAELTLGDGSNVLLPGYTLDTSLWTTNGVVTVVPEPASVALLFLGAVPLLLRRQR